MVVRGPASTPEFSDFRWGIPATRSRLEAASRKCGSTMALGYRVYFARCGEELVILIAGGNKRSQKRDIAMAIELARNL